MKQTTICTNDDYKQFAVLVNERAYHWARVTGVEYDDVFAQANFIFVKAAHEYNPHKGAAFSTYLHNYLNWKLPEYCHAELAYSHWMDEVQPWDEPVYVQPDSITFLDAMRILSEDAQRILSLVFFREHELQQYNPRKDNSVYAKRITKELIKKYLRAQGWPNYQINETFDELRYFLQKNRV